MRPLLLSLLVCLLMCSEASRSQTTFTWDDFEQMMTTDGDDDEGDEEWAEQMEELKFIHEHPINLAVATRADLDRLPFLNEAQVEAIIEFAYLHRPVRSLGDLRLIPQLDYDDIQALSLFLYIDNTSATEAKPRARDIVKNLKSQLDSRLDIPLYYREGYGKTNGYRGDALYHRIRYTLSDKRHVQIGAHVEKDAGERYYDSWGAYGMLCDVGVVERLVVGDYRVGFGEGLVVGGSGWWGKSLMQTRAGQGVRPMTGTDEGNFLRGAASTLRLSGGLSLSAFVSYRKLDATLTDEGEAKTIVSSGLHRTSTERAKRGNLGLLATGGDLTWRHKRTTIGLTGLFQRFSKPLAPMAQTKANAYRRYYPQGQQFSAFSLHYAQSLYRLQFAGEAAVSTGRKGVATTHRIEWLASSNWSFSASGRYYSEGYYSQFARATSESGGVRNEVGGNLRMVGRNLLGCTLTAYIDLFYNHWPRYQMTTSSAGQDAMIELLRALGSRHTFSVRYQMKRKAKSDVMQAHHRYRAQWTWTPSSHLRSQTTLVFHTLDGHTGYALGETCKGAWRKEQWRASLSMAYFHTPDYLTRVYVYKPSLQSTVGYNQLSGHGLRLSATARWTTPGKRFMFEALISAVRYFDRSTQGSGLETIQSAWKNDISVQAVFKI